MRDLAPRVSRTLAKLRVLDLLVGLGAGVVAAVVVATVLLAFGASASATLEDAYEPSSSAVD